MKALGKATFETMRPNTRGDALTSGDEEYYTMNNKERKKEKKKERKKETIEKIEKGGE